MMISTQNWRRIRWLLATMLAIAVPFLLIMLFCFHYIWQSRSDAVFAVLLPTDARIEQDIRVLQQLDRRYPDPSCSPATLTAMRRAEFSASYLREFGLVSANKLLCTTVLGTLPTPVSLAPADITDDKGLEFTRSARVTSTGAEQSAMQVKIGSFRALIHQLPTPASQTPWLDIGIFAVNGQHFTPVYGQTLIAPVSASQAPDKRYRLEDGRWVAESCYNDASCAVVSVDIAAYFLYDKEASLLVLLSVLLVSGSAVTLSGQLCERHMTLGRQLARGLSEDRIQCLYQPILTLATDQFDSCEVLCRWYDEDGQVQSPALFIPEIENNGQARQLTRVVMKKAVTELTAAGLSGKIRFAINTFPEDIDSGHIEQVIDELLPADLHQQVTIEITEREIEDMEGVARGIHRLRRKSVLVAIDDFGTGYSNFQHLKALQVDYLKIDRSFIHDMESRGIRGDLVGSIVHMADTLDILTVAEGVEDELQLAQLKKLGVSMSQGYFHARPMPVAELARFIGQASPSDLSSPSPARFSGPASG